MQLARVGSTNLCGGKKERRRKNPRFHRFLAMATREKFRTDFEENCEFFFSARETIVLLRGFQPRIVEIWKKQFLRCWILGFSKIWIFPPKYFPHQGQARKRLALKAKSIASGIKGSRVSFEIRLSMGLPVLHRKGLLVLLFASPDNSALH